MRGLQHHTPDFYRLGVESDAKLVRISRIICRIQELNGKRALTKTEYNKKINEIQKSLDALKKASGE